MASLDRRAHRVVTRNTAGVLNWIPGTSRRREWVVILGLLRPPFIVFLRLYFRRRVSRFHTLLLLLLLLGRMPAARVKASGEDVA
jgi:hypothetical protein